MKQVKIGNKEYIFAELASNQSWNPEFPTHLTWELSIGTYSEPYIMPIFDSDSWRKDTKIITTTNSITEEIAKSLMEEHRWAKPYSHLWTKIGVNKDKECWWVSSALESFYSLMGSLGLDRSNKNYLLVEKLKQ